MKNQWSKPTIFTDIDGVLATVKQYNISSNSKSWLRKYNVYPFDPKCVKIFNEIVDKTDAEIVVSSDWRVDYTMEELCDIFTINGVLRTPVDVTPFYPTSMSSEEKNRAGEILKYVDEHEIEKWVAIDDLVLFGFLPEENFILCKSDWEGIKQSGLKQKMLNKLL